MERNQTPKQLNDLGDQCFYGNDHEKNIELAFTYYKKAADLNNPVGYYNVAKYFIAKEQYKQALEYLTKSKALGYAYASIQMSDMYLQGLGVRKSKKKAFRNMEEAVHANDVSALHRLGDFYRLGIGCKKSEIQAQKYYQLSADNNMAEGMYCLGMLFLEAKTIKKDYENGFFWLDKAAQLGNEPAIIQLKALYQNKHPYLRKKSLMYLQEMAFYYNELHAKLNHVESLIEVADIYFEGNEIVKINYEKAYEYYRRLKALDETKGYTGIGLMKLYGRGLDVDYKEAKAFLEIASTRNDLTAMNALGEIYRLGFGVDVNYQRAKDYYFEAAKGNETNALINMGLLNYRNQIHGANPKLAFQYMSNAANKGNELAYYWLGIFYDKGVGVEKDFKKAEAAFKKAIEANHYGAKYKYAQLLIEYTETNKMSNKKRNGLYIEIRDLLFDYIQAPGASEVNTTYAMYLLGELFSKDDFNLKSAKIARYYYELASEKKFAKAMVRMYDMLKNTELEVACDYIKEAVKQPNDGEALFVMANIFLEGNPYIPKDMMKAKEFYGKAAGLNYVPAKEKLTML